MRLREIAATSVTVVVLILLMFNVTAYSVTAVNFTASPASGNSPLQVQFTDTTPGDDSHWTWHWDFQDGSPPSTDKNPVHTFTDVRTYRVTLTIINSLTIINGSNGVIGTVSHDITIASGAATPSPSANESTASQNVTVTPTPGKVSIIAGAGGSTINPTPDNARSTPKPSVNATAGGFNFSFSNGIVQIIIAALVAVVIGGGVLYYFHSLGRQPQNTSKAKAQPAAPVVKKDIKLPALSTKSSMPPKDSLPPKANRDVFASAKPSTPTKKVDDLSQDYLYGLVTGQGNDMSEQARAEKLSAKLNVNIGKAAMNQPATNQPAPNQAAEKLSADQDYLYGLVTGQKANTNEQAAKQAGKVKPAQSQYKRLR